MSEETPKPELSPDRFAVISKKRPRKRHKVKDLKSIECPECGSYYCYYRLRHNNWQCRKCGNQFVPGVKPAYDITAPLEPLENENGTDPNSETR